MLHEWKIPFRKILMFSFAAVLILPACSNSQGDSTSISTPAQEKHVKAFLDYMKLLEQEGLTTAKEIQVKESQPFIFILKPQNQEVTDEDIENVTDLAVRTVSLFDSGEGLKHDDIDIAFHRPAEQKIVLIKRSNMPELLRADIYGEMTISIDKTYFRSFVNLAGPVKNGNQGFTNAWSIVQAICLAYSGDFQDSDPVCNIISANAAAGWVGMARKQAAELINEYGMTDLNYLGSNDYRYRFIDFVYDAFLR